MIGDIEEVFGVRLQNFHLICAVSEGFVIADVKVILVPFFLLLTSIHSKGWIPVSGSREERQ